MKIVLIALTTVLAASTYCLSATAEGSTDSAAARVQFVAEQVSPAQVMPFELETVKTHRASKAASQTKKTANVRQSRAKRLAAAMRAAARHLTWVECDTGQELADWSGDHWVF